MLFGCRNLSTKIIVFNFYAMSEWYFSNSTGEHTCINIETFVHYQKREKWSKSSDMLLWTCNGFSVASLRPTAVIVCNVYVTAIGNVHTASMFCSYAISLNTNKLHFAFSLDSRHTMERKCIRKEKIKTSTHGKAKCALALLVCGKVLRCISERKNKTISFCT